MDNCFYTKEELEKLNLKSFGENILISKKCSIYSPSAISIGSNVRIDDYTILTGEVSIGDYVHIAAFCALYGKGGIKIGNFCTISANSILYSQMDDFSGNYLVSPMVPVEYVNVGGGGVV